MNQTSNILPLDSKYFYYLRYVTSNDNVKALLFALSYIVIPMISLLGVAGNVLTIKVLLRHGFRKSYNIFIFALAIADTLFLIGVNNVPRILLLSQKFGFCYSWTESLILYIMFVVQNGMELNGKYMSMILPTFISFERFIAVYFPLHLKSVVTCKRAKLAVTVLFVSWVPVNVYFLMLLRFDYLLDPFTNTTVGYIMRSDLMLNHPDVYKVLSGFYFMLGGPVPVLFVISFCIVIGVKIQTINNQRKHLKNAKSFFNLNNEVPQTNKCTSVSISAKKSRLTTGGVQTPKHNVDICSTGLKCEVSSVCKFDNAGNSKIGMASNGTGKMDQQQKETVSQTTITLLSMCVVYAIIVTSSSLPSIILNRTTWESDIGAVVELCAQLAVSINSSSNFLIYVTMNRNFRTTLRRILS